jgi:hypothetical protein
MNIVQYLSSKGVTASEAEAIKLISDGSIAIDEYDVSDMNADLDENIGYFIQVGKAEPYFLNPDNRKIYGLKLHNPNEIKRSIVAGQFEGPIVVKEAATITGNYRSTDSGTPAVWIWTEQPVTILNCNIEAAGNGIHFETRGQATIKNNNIKGITPSGDRVKGRAVYCFKPQYAIVENNYFESTGGGVMIDQTDATPAKKISIRFNQFKNMDKRKANPMDFNGIEHKAGIMLSSNNNLPDCEIAWNEIINEPGNSWVEDLINCLNSGGIATSHIKIHDNYLFGAYPFPVTANDYTGSGITVDGNPSNNTLETTSKFIDVYNNQVISTCNACFNIAAGHDIKAYNNTFISSGMYPDGTASDRFWGGFCIYDGSNVGPSVFINNSIENNVVGYVRKNVSVPYPNRQDYVRDSKTPAYVDYTKNTFLPNPITLQTEKDEFPKWTAKLALNKVVIGNANNPNPNTTTPTTTPTPTDLTFKIGQTITGKITPINKDGNAAYFKPKSVKVSSSATTKVGVSVSITDEQVFTVIPKGIGTSRLTVSFTSKSGKVISKVYNVAVEGGDDEATDMKVEFSVK